MFLLLAKQNFLKNIWNWTFHMRIPFLQYINIWDSDIPRHIFTNPQLISLNSFSLKAVTYLPHTYFKTSYLTLLDLNWSSSLILVMIIAVAFSGDPSESGHSKTQIFPHIQRCCLTKNKTFLHEIKSDSSTVCVQLFPWSWLTQPTCNYVWSLSHMLTYVFLRKTKFLLVEQHQKRIRIFHSLYGERKI